MAGFIGAIIGVVGAVFWLTVLEQWTQQKKTAVEILSRFDRMGSLLSVYDTAVRSNVNEGGLILQLQEDIIEILGEKLPTYYIAQTFNCHRLLDLSEEVEFAAADISKAILKGQPTDKLRSDFSDSQIKFCKELMDSVSLKSAVQQVFREFVNLFKFNKGGTTQKSETPAE